MKTSSLKRALCLAPLLLAFGQASLQAQNTPIFSEPFTCPSGQIFHTVNHDDLTTGSLPDGITVTTAVTDLAGTTTVSTPGVTLAGAGSGFVTTTPFIDGGGSLRFVNTDNEAVQVVYTFSRPLTNPFMFVQSDGPEQGTTFQLFQADGVTPIPVTKIDGDAEMVVTGGSLVENTDVSAGAQNHAAYFQVQDNTARSTIILRIFNNAPHGLDGYNVGIGACVPDPTTSFPALPCPTGSKVYTVDHTDLTQGTLPFGTTVSTVVSEDPPFGPTVSTVTAAGFASAFNNTSNIIESGGGLRFVTTDGESVDVAFTFSKAVRNPYVFIGTDGPEPGSVTQLFEADGITPITFKKIDGEPQFGVNGGTDIVNTDPTATNRTGYVQVQDNIARTKFILRITNGGTFGLDGYNVGIGVCRAEEWTYYRETALNVHRYYTGLGQPDLAAAYYYYYNAIADFYYYAALGNQAYANYQYYLGLGYYYYYALRPYGESTRLYYLYVYSAYAYYQYFSIQGDLATANAYFNLYYNAASTF